MLLAVLAGGEGAECSTYHAQAQLQAPRLPLAVPDYQGGAEPAEEEGGGRCCSHCRSSIQ